MNDYQGNGAPSATHGQAYGNTSGSLITPELLHSFIVEVKGYLPRIESGIVDYFNQSATMQPTAMERLAEAHGYSHTVKKAALVIGMTPLANIAEKMGGLLEKVAMGLIPLNAQTLNGFREVVAHLGVYLDHSAIGGALPPTELVEALYAIEHPVVAAPVAAPEPAEPEYTVAPAVEPVQPPQMYVLSESYAPDAIASEPEPQYYAEPTVNARNSGRLAMPAQEPVEPQPIKADLPPVYVLTPQYTIETPAPEQAHNANDPLFAPPSYGDNAAFDSGYATPLHLDASAAAGEWQEIEAYHWENVGDVALSAADEADVLNIENVQEMPVMPPPTSEPFSAFNHAATLEEPIAYVWPDAPATVAPVEEVQPPAAWVTYQENIANPVEYQYEAPVAYENPITLDQVLPVVNAPVEEFRTTAEFPAVHLNQALLAANEAFGQTQEPPAVMASVPPPPQPPPFPAVEPTPVNETHSFFAEGYRPFNAPSEPPTRELPTIPVYEIESSALAAAFEPVVDAPVTETPVTETPVVDAPVVEAHEVEMPQRPSARLLLDAPAENAAPLMTAGPQHIVPYPFAQAERATEPLVETPRQTHHSGRLADRLQEPLGGFAHESAWQEMPAPHHAIPLPPSELAESKALVVQAETIQPEPTQETAAPTWAAGHSHALPSAPLPIELPAVQGYQEPFTWSPSVLAHTQYHTANLFQSVTPIAPAVGEEYVAAPVAQQEEITLSQPEFAPAPLAEMPAPQPEPELPPVVEMALPEAPMPPAVQLSGPLSAPLTAQMHAQVEETQAAEPLVQTSASPASAEVMISWEGAERPRTVFDARTVWGQPLELDLPETLPSLPPVFETETAEPLVTFSQPEAEPSALSQPPGMPVVDDSPFAALLSQLTPHADARPHNESVAVPETPFAFAQAEVMAQLPVSPPAASVVPVVEDDFLEIEPEAPVSFAVKSERQAAAQDWSVPPELLEVFLPEAEEHLSVITNSLPKLAAHPEDKNLLQGIRRSTHSLKGSSAVVGFLGITKLAHRMEDLLDLLYDGALTLTPEMLDLLFSSTEALENLLSNKSEPEMVGSLYAAYERILSAPNEAPAAATSFAPPQPTASADVAAELDDEPLFVDESLDEYVWDTPVGQSHQAMPVELTHQAAPMPQASFVQPPVEAPLPAPTAWSEPSAWPSQPEQPEPQPFAPLPAWHAAQQDSLAQRAMALQEETAPSASPVVEQEIAPIQPAVMSEHAARAAQEPAQIYPSMAASDAMAKDDKADSAEKAAQAAIINRGNYVRVPIERLDSVVKLVTELIVNRATLEQNMSQFNRQLEELRGNAQRLSRVANRMEVQYEASTLGSGLQSVRAGGATFVNALPGGNTKELKTLASPVVMQNDYGFDALEFDRYTEFHLLLRELTECSGDMQTMERELRMIREYFESSLNRQGRLNSEMQDQLMRLRMVPLASFSSRLNRTAHQVAQQRNKQVNFIIEGEDTRLDKTVMEELGDPLLHILRNAIDHGIEAAGTRQALGKHPVGTVRLRAYHEGTQTVIQITDDGAGLQPERLRAKAVQGGLCSPADAAKMSEEEVFSLIFIPGLSTATEVSEISGRGVGMDVVKTTIQRLKGRIDVESKAGVGTAFTIRLPMTLAVMRALLVKTHKQTFAIPPIGLQQIVKLTPQMLDRVGDQQVIRINNKIYPLMQLGRLLNLKRQPGSDQASLGLLMNLEDRQFAIAVDETLGGRDVVVKNLGNHIREVRGITGTTLMGDGSAVLILNLPELVRDSLRPASALMHRGSSVQAASARPRMRPPAEQRAQLSVMVVDDSLSVRRVLANRLSSVGWKAVQAKDGLDALEQLQHSAVLPDVILLDIEMPRMDGYEFLSALRKHESYANLPVVMITSRAGQKHRDRAFEAGANEYLVKPYQDEELLTLIRRLAQKQRD